MVIQSDTDEEHFDDKSHEILIAADDVVNKISKRKRKCTENLNLQLSSCVDSAGNQKKQSQVDESDLDELRSIYKKCKAVMQKLERKYGHLLNDNDASTTSTHDNNDDDEKCTCTLNKKIIFDDDGQELCKELDRSSHICPKKLKPKCNENKNIEIEYDTPDTLPEDILNLSKILHDENLEVLYRRRVIDKIKLMKQDYINDIKFNKPSLIEQSKVNPDEVFDFIGTNLSILSGYV